MLKKIKETLQKYWWVELIFIFIVHLSFFHFFDFRDSNAEKSIFYKVLNSAIFAFIFMQIIRLTIDRDEEDYFADPAYFDANQFDVLKAHLEKNGYEQSKVNDDKVYYKLRKFSLRNLSNDVYIISTKHHTSINAPRKILDTLPSGLEKLQYVYAV